MQAEFQIRRLEPADVEGYGELRLEGLRLEPDAFGASLEEELALGPEGFADRLGPGRHTYGGFDGEMLAGTVAMVRGSQQKSRHKALLVGMYVRPAFRGRGLARRLIAHLLTQASLVDGLEMVQLAVGTSNAAAIRTYLAAGFEIYGTERHAMKIAGRYVDEHHMVRFLRA